jgi:hypothetical protein
MQPLVTSLAPWQIILILAFYAGMVWLILKLADDIRKGDDEHGKSPAM